MKTAPKLDLLLGFFLSGNYTDVVDPDPQYGGVMRMKQSPLMVFSLHPIVRISVKTEHFTGVLYNTDFATKG
jgi:hypothetical protein